MQIVTLTTDFGTQDFYVGALKGALLRRFPAMQLVDISHHIEPFDIVQGAFVLRNVWREFPEGTIHLIGVNCVYDSGFQFLAMRREGHFFLAPDNGLLTLLFEQISPGDVRLIQPEAGLHFPEKTVFAEAVGHIAEQKTFETLGEFPAPLLERISIQPVIMPNRIRGTIIHIDHFENVLINIHHEVFEKARNGRDFSLYFKRNDPVTRLSNNYCDVPVGDTLCFFNSTGYLELAINMGRAAGLLGLKVEDVVEVVFDEAG